MTEAGRKCGSGDQAEFEKSGKDFSELERMAQESGDFSDAADAGPEAYRKAEWDWFPDYDEGAEAKYLGVDEQPSDLSFELMAGDFHDPADAGPEAYRKAEWDWFPDYDQNAGFESDLPPPGADGYQ